MGAMAPFHLQNMFSFRYLKKKKKKKKKKKIGVLDSYFIHGYIIIKYRSNSI